MSASAKSLRSKLVRKAYENPGLRSKVLPILKKKANKLSSGQRSALADAIRLNRELGSTSKEAKNPTVEIETLPTMSPVQVRAMLDGIVAARQQAEQINAQIEVQLKKLKELSKEEKAGIEQIKKCGGMLAEKTNYLLETEKYLLKFKAVVQGKPPGVVQVMKSPDEVKGGKAGDLRNRILTTFEKDVADQVLNLIEAAIKDATNMSKFAKAIDIVQKTSSVPPSIVKNAGLVDTVVSIKEWIVGGTNSMMQRLIGFAGDIKKWVMGFTERGRIAKSSRDKIKKGLDSIDKMMGDLEKEVA